MAAAIPAFEKATKGAKSAAAVEFIKGQPKQLLIGGKWVPAKSGKTFDHHQSRQRGSHGLVAEGDKADVDEAVKAARKAFEEGAWPAPVRISAPDCCSRSPN